MHGPQTHFSLAAAALILTPGAALAGHGKAGLWNTVTTTNMAMAMPPGKRWRR